MADSTTLSIRLAVQGGAEAKQQLNDLADAGEKSAARTKAAFEKLALSNDPAARAQQKIAQGQDLINLALASGVTTSEKAADATQKLTSRWTEFAGAATGAGGKIEGFREILRGATDAASGNLLGLGRASAMLANSFGLLGPLASPVVGGLLAIVGAGIAAEVRLEEQSAAATKYNVKLQALGSSLSLTGEGVRKFADDLARTGPFSEDQMEAAAGAAMRVPGIGDQDFKTILSTSKDLAAVIGGEVEPAARLLARAFEGDFGAVQQLDSLLSGKFKSTQLEHIKDLDAQNRGVEAGRAVIDALRDSLAGAADRGLTPFAQGLKSAGNAWRGFLDVLGTVGDASDVTGTAVMARLDAAVAARGVAPGVGAGSAYDRPSSSGNAQLFNADEKAADALTHTLTPLFDVKQKLKNEEDLLTRSIAEGLDKTGLYATALDRLRSKEESLLTPVEESTRLLQIQQQALSRPPSERGAYVAGQEAELRARQGGATPAEASAIGANARTQATLGQVAAVRDLSTEIAREIQLSAQEAQAYVAGAAQGVEADARRQASLAALGNSFINVAARTRDLINQQAAQTVVSAGPEVDKYREAAAAEQRVADASRLSAAAAHQATLENTILAATYKLRAVAANENVAAELRLAATKEAGAIRGSMEAADQAQTTAAINAEIRLKSDALAVDQRALAVGYADKGNRVEQIALLQSELEIRRQFPTASQQLVDTLAKVEAADAKVLGQIKDQKQAQQDLNSTVKETFQAVSSGIESALQGHSTWKKALDGIEQKLLDIGTKKFFNEPLEKMLDGWLSGGSGSGGSGGGGTPFLLGPSLLKLLGFGGGSSPWSESNPAQYSGPQDPGAGTVAPLSPGAPGSGFLNYGSQLNTAATQLSSAATAQTTAGNALSTAGQQMDQVGNLFKSISTMTVTAGIVNVNGGVGGGDLPGGGGILSALSGASPGASGADTISGVGADGIAGGVMAKGGVFDRGNVVPFAAGGTIVSRPTRFGLADGRHGLMGEAGPESIMPLVRNSRGLLGVSSTGAGAGPTFNLHMHTTVNVNGAGADAADKVKLTQRQVMESAIAMLKKHF